LKTELERKKYNAAVSVAQMSELRYSGHPQRNNSDSPLASLKIITKNHENYDRKCNAHKTCFIFLSIAVPNTLFAPTYCDMPAGSQTSRTRENAHS
jgi:hypothetical protein